MLFNSVNTNFGAVTLEKAQLERNKCVKVTLISDNNLEVRTENAAITTTVPNDHTINVTAMGNAEIRINGDKGSTFSVERLSEPTLEIKIPDGEELVKAVLNGEDITDKLANGKYTLPPVYENIKLEVETKTKDS